MAVADILRPELVWIEGRCYRVNEPVLELSSFHEHDLYEQETEYQDEDKDIDDNIEVTMIGDSRYSTHFHVPKHYLGSIIGKKGATKMRIEHETRTTIRIPKQGQSGDIVILGPSPGNVKMARRRIDMIVVSSRSKQKTHFLNIPLNTPEIIENCNKFKEAVLRECPDRGIEESIFQNFQKVHLTIGVTSLMDSEERAAAAHLLMDAREQIIVPLLQDHEPLRIRVKGVSYMNDDPREVHVLYASAAEERPLTEERPPACRLQRLADDLLRHFHKAGYMSSDNDNLTVKLHATLMNTRYRGKDDKETALEGKKQWQKRVPFDATRVLEKFADFDFGVVDLTDIHLSLMDYYGQDGYYQPSCVVSCY